MRTRPLDELADLTVGHVGPMASEYVKDGVPFLRSLNIRPFRIDVSGIKFISREFHERLKKSALRPGDVVVVRTGEPGTAAVIPESLPEANCSDVVIVRPGPGLDPWYLAYLINGVSRGFVNSRMVGAVQQHFNVGAARELPVPDLSLEEQRRIAGALGALDDLIDTNRGLAQRLDSRLVASWMALARRCHTERVLGELVDLRKGVSYKGTYLAEQGLPLINLANFALDGSFKESGTKHYLGPVKDQQLLSKGSLVVANTDLTQRCEILARPLLVPFQAATSTHHTFQVEVRGSDARRGWIFCALRTEVIRRRLISFATGTTVAALPADALLSQEIPWASEQVIDSWWSKASTLRQAQESVAAETRELDRARNEVLPPLLSGQVRVGDVAA